ncbi:MAG: amino acid ABC transporter permease [Anaerolineales bacterium]|nr:amino acid ABC transporter permease [Anaerolineales bacterium]
MAPSSSSAAAPSSSQGQLVTRLTQLPWWLILMLLAGVLLTYQILNDDLSSFIFDKLSQGILTTILVTVIAYFFAILLGLLGGLGRVSKNPVLYNLATLYVQIIRGVPILVQIFYFAFVMVPAITALLNALGQMIDPGGWLATLSNQDLPMIVRVVVALAFAYGGFESETFRAGIESIGKGQMEAARSLGMSYVQAMRYVILPQAIRRILPPLGNDFVSMLKDSSLVSVLGVRDITQEARLYMAASFVYPPTLNMLAFIYLSMTLILSLAVKWLENRMGKDGH